MSAAASSEMPPVQRVFGFGSLSGRTTGALAASAAAAVADTFSRLRTSSSQHNPPHDPPPAYSADPPQDPPPPYSAASAAQPGAGGDEPPAYTAVPHGGFDPRALTDFQLDELVHRIIGRVTRLVRADLRMDRERIGRLRDPR